MKISCSSLAAFCFVLLSFSLSAEDKKAPFFNKEDLTGWSVDNKEFAGHWRVEGDAIVGDNPDQKGSILWTEKDWQNYDFELQYRTSSADYDSGVFVRGESHQVQIGVSRSLRKDLTGCIYAPKDGAGLYPAETDKVGEVHQLGEWNRLRIVAHGKRIQVFLNDERMVDYEGVVFPEKGKIGLQLHAGVHQTMEFKDFVIRPAVAPEPDLAESQYGGEVVPVPEGAVVLFDGSSLDGWYRSPKKDDKDQSKEPKWKVENGYMEVAPSTGFHWTKEKLLTSGHLHLEWCTPEEIKGRGQGRGNSGVFVQGFPEIQVLDSWKNYTYPDGQAGALYLKSVPLANASRAPGEWQSYDIQIKRAKDGAKASLTVHHNGVLIQDGFEVGSSELEGALGLQDHSNPVRFRNIWFVPD